MSYYTYYNASRYALAHYKEALTVSAELISNILTHEGCEPKCLFKESCNHVGDTNNGCADSIKKDFLKKADYRLKHKKG